MILELALLAVALGLVGLVAAIALGGERREDFCPTCLRRRER